METDKQVLKLAVLAGTIMLENGAETYRVEDTMNRILTHFDSHISESFVTTTGVFATIEGDNHHPLTILRRVKNRTIDLGKIVLVNELSRNIVANQVTVADAFLTLQEIEKRRPYHPALKTLAAGVCTFCFTFTFGGSLADCGSSFLTGATMMAMVLYLLEKKISAFLVNLVGGCMISLFALVLLSIGIADNLDKVIIGSIMPLVPGVIITNAVRDVLEGDFLSGSSRIFDACIVALAIATGVGVVMNVWLFFFGRIVL